MVRIPAFIALVLLLVATAHPLPRFALTAGARCSSCHVNPGGGGMRNAHGLTFGVGSLTMSSHADEDGDPDDPPFDPRLSENVSIGGDLRTQFLYETAGSTTAFHQMAASVYGEVRLSREISAYAKFDLVNAQYGERGGPEAFVIARVLPGRWHLKAGNFLPSYGTRLDDHTAYTRGGDLGSFPAATSLPGLLFVPNYKDIGIEIGGSSGGFEAAAGIFNGTGNAVRIDFREEKAVAVRLEYAASAGPARVAAGGSGYVFGAYRMAGFHAGIGTPGFAIYGEADFTRNRIVPSGFSIDRGSDAMAAFVAADVLLVRGAWATARFDLFDPARGTADDAFTRVTLGLELFPWPFIEVRPQYRIAGETPAVDNDAGLVQLHAWF